MAWNKERILIHRNWFRNGVLWRLVSSSPGGADSTHGYFPCFRLYFVSLILLGHPWSLVSLSCWVVVETMATSKSGLVMGDGDRQLDFDRELKWCIQSLEGCLKEKHCDPKSKKVFDVLNSSKATFVRKRWVLCYSSSFLTFFYPFLPGKWWIITLVITVP